MFIRPLSTSIIMDVAVIVGLVRDAKSKSVLIVISSLCGIICEYPKASKERIFPY